MVVGCTPQCAGFQRVPHCPSERMRVVIRHAALGFYYAGHRQWVLDPCAAMDLGTVKRAKELSHEESLGQVEVVAIYDGAAGEFVLPLERKEAA